MPPAEVSRPTTAWFSMVRASPGASPIGPTIELSTTIRSPPVPLRLATAEPSRIETAVLPALTSPTVLPTVGLEASADKTSVPPVVVIGPPTTPDPTSTVPALRKPLGALTAASITSRIAFGSTLIAPTSPPDPLIVTWLCPPAVSVPVTAPPVKLSVAEPVVLTSSTVPPEIASWASWSPLRPPVRLPSWTSAEPPVVAVAPPLTFPPSSTTPL